MEKIIGRKKEIQALTEYYNSGKPEFIAVYGRRRIGKTFLVRNTFKDKLCFDMTGSIDGSTEVQLSNFWYALKDLGNNDISMPKNWNEAFNMLRHEIQPMLNGKRIVIFIDELPCLDIAKSGFKQAFEHFWNGWAGNQQEIMLVVCGSATSWMIENLIDSHGGLHNRITHEIHLAPFSLGETEEMLQEKGIVWPRISILQIYSIMGGVPYYLNLLDNGMGVEGNVDKLFFSEFGELKREYSRLYSSLFKNSETYMKAIEALAACKKGMTRKELANKLNRPSGGTLTKILKELTSCEFIRGYRTREKRIKQKDMLYQITDLYTMFYMTFCKNGTTDNAFWSHLMGKPKQNTWYGLAFERICMLHIEQIKQALGIDRIHTEYYSWRSKTSMPAAQIDLIIERDDNLVNLCEIKYSQAQYSMTKEEEMKIRNRIADFTSETAISKGIITTMITTYGTRKNQHSAIVQSEVTMDDLFKF